MYVLITLLQLLNFLDRSLARYLGKTAKASERKGRRLAFKLRQRIYLLLVLLYTYNSYQQTVLFFKYLNECVRSYL